MESQRNIERIPRLVCTIMMLFLASFAFADAEGDEEPLEGPARRIRILDTANPDEAREIRRHVREGLPEGFTLRLEYDIAPAGDGSGAINERLRFLVPVNEEGQWHGTAAGYPLYGSRNLTVDYVDGKKHGVERTWMQCHVTHKIYMNTEVEWKNDKRHGKRVHFYSDGSIQMIAHFEDDQLVGESRSYTQQGNLLEVSPNEDGQKHGDTIRYWPDTEIPSRIIPYVRGLVHGVVREYHNNGNLRRELPYKNNLLHGIQKEYDREGKLVRERYWLDGEIVQRAEFEQNFKE